MPEQTEKTYEELAAEITELTEKNEILSRQLLRVGRDVARLAGTNTRLFQENQELIRRDRSRVSERERVTA